MNQTNKHGDTFFCIGIYEINEVFYMFPNSCMLCVNFMCYVRSINKKSLNIISMNNNSITRSKLSLAIYSSVYRLILKSSCSITSNKSSWGFFPNTNGYVLFLLSDLLVFIFIFFFIVYLFVVVCLLLLRDCLLEYFF